MNSIPKVLPKHIQKLFRRIEDDLNTDLYFYGSVIRSDYIPNKSDIDVAIFSDNEQSDITKLQHILKVPRKEFHKVVWKLNGHMIYGYKIKIPSVDGEICIYNNEYKDLLLDELTKPLKNTSMLVYLILYVLKFFYYHVPLLPRKTYAELKRIIMNEIIDKKESVYYILS